VIFGSSSSLHPLPTAAAVITSLITAFFEQAAAP
jgi:hypothetical protein